MTQKKKVHVLKFVAERARVKPQELAVVACPTLRAAYMYLLNLHRQGLLYRERTADGIFYRISPRGRERLLYLEGLEKARWR